MGLMVCETTRLRISHFSEEADAAFMLRLLNEPSFIRNIADRNVRTLDDARAYLRNGPIASYARHGFGLSRVALKEDDTPIGMCGLIRRDNFADVDIGYAFLPEFWSKGYAIEAARGVLDTALQVHGLRRVIGVVNPDNADSSRVLEKLGFVFEKMVRMQPEKDEIRQFAITLPAA